MTEGSPPTLDDAELRAALEQARGPLQVPAMPRVGLWLRAKTSPRLRALLPTPVVVLRARLRSRIAWARRADMRRLSRQTMEAILSGTPRAGETGELAREHFVQQEIYRELFWQPWRLARMDRRSQENARRALDSDRGVLLSSCHLGPIFRHISAITALGRTAYIASAPWFFEQPTPDYWGLRIARWWICSLSEDKRYIRTTRSFPVLRALLDQGELVVIYFDMPGSRRTRFLGKPVMLSSGSARLACETDAIVLPVRARMSASRVFVDVAPPLDPRDFPGHAELHDALAAIHERWILELPATLEDPNRDGAWEGGATAEGWALPSDPGSDHPQTPLPEAPPAPG